MFFFNLSTCKFVCNWREMSTIDLRKCLCKRKKESFSKALVLLTRQGKGYIIYIVEKYMCGEVYEK